jgi:hypothetical protein
MKRPDGGNNFSSKNQNGVGSVHLFLEVFML